MKKYEFYTVRTAYEVNFRNKQSEVFKTYAEAEQTAGNDTFIEEVDIITRNCKQAKSHRDKQKLAVETADIEARGIWYDYNGVKGMIAQDTKRVIKKPEPAEVS